MRGSNSGLFPAFFREARFSEISQAATSPLAPASLGPHSFEAYSGTSSSRALLPHEGWRTCCSPTAVGRARPILGMVGATLLETSYSWSMPKKPDFPNHSFLCSPMFFSDLVALPCRIPMPRGGPRFGSTAPSGNFEGRFCRRSGAWRADTGCIGFGLAQWMRRLALPRSQGSHYFLDSCIFRTIECVILNPVKGRPPFIGTCWKFLFLKIQGLVARHWTHHNFAERMQLQCLCSLVRVPFIE